MLRLNLKVKTAYKPGLDVLKQKRCVFLRKKELCGDYV